MRIALLLVLGALSACAARLDGALPPEPAAAPASAGEAVATPRDVVILGRTPGRMNEVRRLLGALEDVRLHSAFTEEDALRRIDAVPNLRVVLLGGATSDATRARIRAHLRARHPGVETSEPGRQYRYSDANILADVARKLR